MDDHGASPALADDVVDLAEYIWALVADWPPLTPDEVATLRAILS